MLQTVLIQFAIVSIAFITALFLLARSIKTYAKGKQSDYVNGSWIRYPVLDKPILNARSRLLAAVFGFLALGKREARYYLAATDGEGQPLNAQNEYIVSSMPPKAAYWSIAIYGADKYLIPNDKNRYSYNNKTVSYEKDGAYNINITKNENDPNHLPCGGEGRFYLYMRTYLPENADETVLPVISKR